MKRWATLALGLAPLVGAVELALHFVFAARAPAFADYASLEAVVRDMKRANDVVVVAPRWADPNARAALGDALMPVRDEARSDVARYAGAVEVSVASQRAPDLAAGGFREDARRDVGGFVVRHLVNPSPARVAFDFVDHLSPDVVSARESSGGACAWNPRARVMAGGLGGDPTFGPQRFDCGGRASDNVGVTVIADEHFLPRRCIWSPPPARGELITRFAHVPLGDVIQGHGGMTWIVERAEHGATVTLSVRVDGDDVGALDHVDGDGWKAFSLPLGKHAREADATVEFSVSTRRDRPGALDQERHFCFEADSR